MLSTKKQEIRSFIKHRSTSKKIKPVLMQGGNSFSLDYRFNKQAVPIGIIAGITVFLLSFWYYLLPENPSFENINPPIISPKKAIKPVQHYQPRKKQKIRHPIVNVMEAKYRPVPKKSVGIHVYNKAIQYDRQKNYVKAVSLYQQALQSNDQRIQKNAKGIQRRIDYLNHQK